MAMQCRDLREHFLELFCCFSHQSLVKPFVSLVACWTWLAIFANLSAFGYFDALLKVKRMQETEILLFKFHAINEQANKTVDVCVKKSEEYEKYLYRLLFV